MLSLVDLELAASKYQLGEVSFDEFADWFHRASRARFAAGDEVRKACLKIDVVLSRLSGGDITEAQSRQELANAIRPFVLNHVIYVGSLRHIFRPEWSAETIRRKEIPVIGPSRDTEFNPTRARLLPPVAA